MEDFLKMLKDKRSKLTPELILEARRLQKSLYVKIWIKLGLIDYIS